MLGWLKPRKLPPTSEQLCLSLLVAVEEVAECGVVQQGTGVSVVIAGEVAPISEAVSLLWSKRNEMLLTQLNMCITRVTELSVVIDQSIGLDHSFLRHVCEEELSDLDTCREFTSRVTSRVLKQVTFDVEAECAKFSTEVLRHSSAALANLVSHMLLAPKPPMETALLSMLFMDTRCRTALCNLFDLLCRASLEVCSTPLSSLWSLWDHVNTQQRRPFRQLPRPPRPDPVTQFLVCNSVPLEVMIRSLPHATLGKYSVLLLKSIFLGLVIQRVIGAVVCQRFNWLAEIHTTRLRELSIKARFTPLINVEFTSLSMGSPSIWLAADELISRKQLLVVLRTLMSEIADFVYLRECHELAILALHSEPDLVSAMLALHRDDFMEAFLHGVASDSGGFRVAFAMTFLVHLIQSQMRTGPLSPMRSLVLDERFSAWLFESLGAIQPSDSRHDSIGMLTFLVFEYFWKVLQTSDGQETTWNTFKRHRMEIMLGLAVLKGSVQERRRVLQKEIMQIM